MPPRRIEAAEAGVPGARDSSGHRPRGLSLRGPGAPAARPQGAAKRGLSRGGVLLGGGWQARPRLRRGPLGP
eukprot:4243746-Alexandrium_andersonii.AAC.1